MPSSPFSSRAGRLRGGREPGNVRADYTMQRLPLFTLGLLAALAVGCGDNGGTPTASDGSTGTPTTTDGTGTGTGGTGTTGETPTTSDSGSSTTGNDTAADGEPCTLNGDCMSLSCIKFRDLEMGTCEAAVGDGNTRFVGTLLNFVTGAPLPNAEVRVVAALTALMNPMAAGLVTATSDGEGRIDATSTMPLNAAFGVVGLVGDGTDLYITATGLAAPGDGGKYPPLNGNHDIWAVPTATLTEWSGYLMLDPALAEYVPLGEKGGVIGFVRDGTGAGKAGAVLKSAKGDSTSALFRYLNDDGLGFNPDMTGSSGIFVIMNPGLAEEFTVEVGGAPTDESGSAGSAPGAAFVLIFTVD